MHSALDGFACLQKPDASFMQAQETGLAFDGLLTMMLGASQPEAVYSAARQAAQSSACQQLTPALCRA